MPSRSDTGGRYELSTCRDGRNPGGAVRPGRVRSSLVATYGVLGCWRGPPWLLQAAVILVGPRLAASAIAEFVDGRGSRLAAGGTPGAGAGVPAATIPPVPRRAAHHRNPTDRPRSMSICSFPNDGSRSQFVPITQDRPPHRIWTLAVRRPGRRQAVRGRRATAYDGKR
jgi:hypothetical protein